MPSHAILADNRMGRNARAPSSAHGTAGAALDATFSRAAS
jgi:hypothetical protein